MIRHRKTVEGGFTLIELMISTFIFSMVVAGLSVIYSTTYKQGFRSLHEAKIKGMSFVTMKALEKTLEEATWLVEPCTGGATENPPCTCATSPCDSGDVLSGFMNYTPTYNPAAPFQKILPAEDMRWFYFCTTDETAGVCETKGIVQPKCLFLYSGKIALPSNNEPIPSVTCGQDGPGGSTKIKLASNLVENPISGAFFSRMVPLNRDDVDTLALGSYGANEDNQVRASFQINHPATNNNPPITYRIDTSFNLGFAAGAAGP